MTGLALMLAALLLAGAEPEPHPGVADPRLFVAGRYALYQRGEGGIPALDRSPAPGCGSISTRTIRRRAASS